MSQETIKVKDLKKEDRWHTVPVVLNIGSGGEGIKMPPWYDGWEVWRLDADQNTKPDILMDARDLHKLAQSYSYDAAYCSHVLEHFTAHEGGAVVGGIYSVVSDSGFADIIVPDVGRILQLAGQKNWDIDSFLYESPSGPICIRDVLYGHERQIGLNEHMVHKNAFSRRTLCQLLGWVGFSYVYSLQSGMDLRAVGFKNKPTIECLESIGMAVTK